MNHVSIELSLIAVLPALFLCGYVFFKDRIEKEPIGLLALLFGAGAVAYIPVFFGQEFIIGLIDNAFADSITFGPSGAKTYASTGDEMTHYALCAFVGFSLLQILVKWALLYFITHKNKNFNHLFDGIVYSVFLSLGFAVAENIHFVWQNDWDMLLAKLLTSVPCHLFIGILMGYYYTMWHVRFTANGIENKMLRSGIVAKDKIRTSAPWLICSLLIPFAVNGIYMFAGSIRRDIVTAIFYSAVFLLYGISFVMIDHIAAKDCSSTHYLCRIIAKGHPELAQEDIESIVNRHVQGTDTDTEKEAEEK